MSFIQSAWDELKKITAETDCGCVSGACTCGKNCKCGNKAEADWAGSNQNSEAIISAWLTAGESRGKDGDICWSKGDSLYSYRTVTAKKKGKTLYINETKYSKTTTGQTSFLKRIAESSGWKVELKPEAFFKTTMVEKLPSGYRDKVRDLIKEVNRDADLLNEAQLLAAKPGDTFDWVKLAKKVVKRYEVSSEGAFNQPLLKILAESLRAKFARPLPSLTETAFMGDSIQAAWKELEKIKASENLREDLSKYEDEIIDLDDKIEQMKREGLVPEKEKAYTKLVNQRDTLIKKHIEERNEIKPEVQLTAADEYKLPDEKIDMDWSEGEGDPAEDMGEPNEKGPVEPEEEGPMKADVSSDPYPNLDLKKPAFDRLWIYDEDTQKIGKPWEVLISGDPKQEAERQANKMFGPDQWKWVKDSSKFGSKIQDQKGDIIEVANKSEIKAAIRIEADDTGEADQDYDKEAYDKICDALMAEGFDASPREFDKYQGVVINVSLDGRLLDKFWTKDYFVQGAQEVNPAEKYKKATLIDENGEEVSANQGDYFQLADDDVMEGCQLILVDKAGNEQRIEEPTKGQLPDLTEVSHGVKFKGKPDQVFILWGEKMGGEESEEAGVSVIIEADGEVLIDQLVSYLEPLARSTARQIKKSNFREGQKKLEKS